MPFPYETYVPARAQLIDIFVEEHYMLESYLTPPESYIQQHNEQADFFVAESCIINNFSKEKPALTQIILKNYMELSGAEKLLVPVVVNNENNHWAIVVYEINKNLIYYNLNGNFSPQEVSAAFCDVMSCHTDNFFTTSENYQGINVISIEQENDLGVLIWATLTGLMNNSLSPDAPFINTLAAQAELDAYQETTDNQINILMELFPIPDEDEGEEQDEPMQPVNTIDSCFVP